jgi:hypothetical protein
MYRIELMKLFFTHIIFITLFFCTAGHSQILNIERFRPSKDTANVWMGNIGLGFSSKKQLNSVINLNTNANVVYLSAKHSYMSINSLNLIRASESQIISEAYSHLRFNFMRRKRISYEPFLQWQYDLGRGLEKRELYGFSLRFRLASGEKIDLSMNSGVMYEHEKWRGEVLRLATDTSYTHAEASFIKSTNNVTLKSKLGNGITLFLLTYYQARYNRFLQPRIISDMKINFKINNHFSFSTQLTGIFDADPIIKNNHLIYEFNNSLVINFH